MPNACVGGETCDICRHYDLHIQPPFSVFPDCSERLEAGKTEVGKSWVKDQHPAYGVWGWEACVERAWLLGLVMGNHGSTLSPHVLINRATQQIDR